MHSLVRILQNEDGHLQGELNDAGEVVKLPPWHYVHNLAGSPHALCTGEVFGMGEGAAVFETKQVHLGGITCRACIAIIKHMKAIKL